MTERIVSAATRSERTISSMLWSAWGDALGFITEFASESELSKRTSDTPLVEPIAWSRRVGGRFGVQALLPAGCYSDDTQLRLATSRSISSYGFDIEAFARVELTVWPAYALGGGRASRSAATSMAKARTTWSTNFFNGWQDAGGNGAAMRIQPHVWAAKDLYTFEHLEDVICNAVVTHGHPRAIIGAVLHAVVLTFALGRGIVPGPDSVREILDITRSSVDHFSHNGDLSSFWVPKWESTKSHSFVDAWNETVTECENMLVGSMDLWDELASFDDNLLEQALDPYRRLCSSLGLFERSTRGSGTATVVAAWILASAFSRNPSVSAQIATLTLGTDTDTIATMAAALVGAASPSPIYSPLLDYDYLVNEAKRLVAISLEQPAPQFSYPDLLHWSPPQSQLECTGLANGQPALAGLGWLTVLEEPIIGRDAAWSWMRTSFGPSILVKQRLVPADLPQQNWPQARTHVSSGTKKINPLHSESQAQASKSAVQESLFESETEEALTREPKVHENKQLRRDELDLAPLHTYKQSEVLIDIDQILEWVAKRKYDEQSLGYAVRRIAESGSAEQLAVFVASVRADIRSLLQ